MPNLRKTMMGAGAAGEIVYPPLAVTGYNAWWRADTVELSGSDVTKWIDRSGNGHHFLRFNVAKSPQLVTSDSNFNNEPTIDLTDNDGTAGDFYRFGTAPGGAHGTVETFDNIFSNGLQTWSIFAAYRNSSAQSAYSYSQIIGDWQGYLWLGPYSATNMNIGNGELNTQTGFTRDTTFASHTWNGLVGSTNLTLKTTGLTTVNSGSNNNFNATSKAMICGGGSAIGQYFQGHIAEIIIYPTALGGSDASTIENYLSSRYGLSW